MFISVPVLYSLEFKLIIFSSLLIFLVKSHSIGVGACLYNLGNIGAGSCIEKDACALNEASIGKGSW